MRSPLYAVAALLTMTSAAVSEAAPGDIQLVSVRDPSIVAPTSSNAPNYTSSVSPDGRFVVYSSQSTDAVPGDTSREMDVLIYDRQTNTTERVSVNSSGEAANYGSTSGTTCSQGRYVAFASGATNLSSDGQGGVFIRDRQAGSTYRISPPNREAHSPVLSGDCRYVAFASSDQLQVFDRNSGTLTSISLDIPNFPRANGIDSLSISATGNRIAVARDHVYVDETGYPRESRSIVATNVSGSTPVLVSVGHDGVNGRSSSSQPAVSGDGRFVSYLSGDAVFLRDLQTSTTTQIWIGGLNANDFGERPALNFDGRYIAFVSAASNVVSGDTNGVRDIFVRDRQSDTTTRVSVATNSAQASAESSQPVISADGNVVAFTSIAALGTVDGNRESDVFVRDRQSATTQLVSVAGVVYASPPGYSGYYSTASLSIDGRYVAFDSTAAILTANDTNGFFDVFVRDRQTGTTSRVSVASNGAQANGNSGEASIDGKGRYVAFYSEASNLVSNDTNGVGDIFVHDRQTGVTKRVSVGPGGAQANDQSLSPFISSNGRFVGFTSYAGNLVPGDANGVRDAFVHDLQTGVTTRVSVASNGAEGSSGGESPTLSADGRYVAFTSYSSNLVPGDTNSAIDGFLRDRTTGTTTRISLDSQGNQIDRGASSVSISAYGRYVAFSSDGTNVTPDNAPPWTNGVFVRDLNMRQTRRASLDSLHAPIEATLASSWSISGDGRYVIFRSEDGALPGDTNNSTDVFIRDMQAGSTRMLSVRRDGAVERMGDRDTMTAAVSESGRFTTLSSFAGNFVDNDLNETSDVFIVENKSALAIRINAGGAGYTDTRGQFWEADRNFNMGASATYTGPIAGTDDDSLYQTERWDALAAPELQYRFTVPNGRYMARLFFAENYPPNFAVGKRVFGIGFNAPPTGAFDIYQIAGGPRIATGVGSTVTVTNGNLDIRFGHQVQNPFVDAIEIVEEQQLAAP